AAKSKMQSSVTAWIIHATGDLAPERILVAVRAMAPVAGIPPTSGTAILAIPCATSSTLGLCLSPLIRSETTADISDSIAPKSATVNAGESSGTIIDGSNVGTTIDGSPCGIPPNRVPIVSTDKPVSATTVVPSTSATIYPGTRGTNFLHVRMTNMLAAASS